MFVLTLTKKLIMNDDREERRNGEKEKTKKDGEINREKKEKENLPPLSVFRTFRQTDKTDRQTASSIYLGTSWRPS